MLALIIGIFLFVGLSEITFRTLRPSWTEFSGLRFAHEILVPGYGRINSGRSNFNGYFAQNNGDFRVHIRTNKMGLRNDEPVSAAHKRIWVVGDSMAFGWGVERGQSYTAKLAQYSGRPTYNIASPATAVCGYKAMLSRMPREVVPAAVVVGLVLENDVLDYDCQLKAKQETEFPKDSFNFGLMSAKVWLTRHSALYNVLAQSLKRINIVNQALIKLGLLRKEHRYRRLLKKSEFKKQVNATVKELNDLRKMLPIGTPIIILIAPARFEIRDEDISYRDLRRAVQNELASTNLPYVDVSVAFKEAGFIATHFAHDGHWSTLGHDIAGKALADWFANNFLNP